MMEKTQVLEAYKEYEVYLASLQTAIQDEQVAHTPCTEGKWSVAQIVMHLAEWDRFVREERLPHMKEGASVEGFEDVDEFNRKAVEGVEKMKFPEILNHAQKERALLRQAIEGLDESSWHARFTAGEKDTSLADYFAGMLEHDHHHLEQINSFLT
ncbi:DinB family protein [Planomicrobium sp. CPCC 101110]|uniref:DinB family protein n=1 Tax=Planomicrobium sp. CPCC 101110 TaxID=2599619 RepID=UPI0011B4B536|nr:DinB family protein [Planomicrobium sp. CPCC 101110]TWT28630.1 DinB family protein [Planomicrobium sp. CPCC 101110]